MMDRRTVVQSCGLVLGGSLAGCAFLQGRAGTRKTATAITPATPAENEIVDLKLHNSTDATIDIEFQITSPESSGGGYTGAESIRPDELLRYPDVFDSGISYHVQIQANYPAKTLRDGHEFAESGDVGTLYIAFKEDNIAFSEAVS